MHCTMRLSTALAFTVGLHALCGCGDDDNMSGDGGAEVETEETDEDTDIGLGEGPTDADPVTDSAPVSDVSPTDVASESGATEDPGDDPNGSSQSIGGEHEMDHGIDASAPGVDDGSPSDGQTEPTLSYSERYITSWTDSRLVFEVDSVPGMEPRLGSESELTERFAALLDKPDGIEVVHDDALEARGDDYEWTPEELFELSSVYFDDDEPAGTVSIHVVFVDGRYLSPAGGTVLGVAWGERYIAMFAQTIEQSCSQLPLLEELERDVCLAAEFGVWSHEVGHVLGLVNNGLEMQDNHEDEEHPHHESREGCLMYWAYDGPSFVDTTIARLGAGQAEIDFCDGSLADIAAVRDAARR